MLKKTPTKKVPSEADAGNMVDYGRSIGAHPPKQPMAHAKRVKSHGGGAPKKATRYAPKKAKVPLIK